jgi:hypothetical protein
MPTPIDRKWITTELVKGLAAGRTLAAEAKDRAQAPPHPSLSVIYNELTAAEDRHWTVLEIIATRYGHTPTANGGGVGETFGWLRDKVAELGSSPLERLTYDLQARTASVLWYTAWVHTFEEIGDIASASDLGPVLAEKQTHCDALQGVLNRLVSERAMLADATTDAAGESPEPALTSA